MRRHNLFLISTLILMSVSMSLLSADSTNAEGVYNGLNYWTAEDLLVYDSEIQAEREAECGNDANCWIELYSDHMDNTERGLERTKFQLLDRFNYSRLVITGFNPTKGTIKVLYHELDNWDKVSNPDATPSQAEELYIAWLEESASDPGLDMSWLNAETGHLVPYYVDDINAGNYESGVHPAFVYHRDTDGPLSGEEIISRETIFNDFMTNSKRAFYLTSIIGNRINYDQVSYASCMMSPFYREGMECGLIYTSNYSSKYVPFTSRGVPATAENIDMDDEPEPTADQTTDPNQTVSPDSTTDPDPMTTPEPITDLEPASSSGTTLDNSTNPDDNIVPEAIAVLSTSTTTPTTPDTGKAEEEEEKETNAIVMPWWITAIIVLGGIAIVWILLPSRQKQNQQTGWAIRKQEKLQKSPKKSLTKNSKRDKMVSV